MRTTSLQESDVNYRPIPHPGDRNEGVEVRRLEDRANRSIREREIHETGVSALELTP